jgi:hypothetical protein
MLTDVYGHVVIARDRDEWREFWLDSDASKAAKRSRGVVSVWSGSEASE